MELFQKLNKKNYIELFEVLEVELQLLGIDYYVIGALARDIMITGKHNIPVPRATSDIDIAIVIPEYSVYDTLKNNLLKRDFTEDKLKVYRLFYKNNLMLDLLPFGGIEKTDGTVNIYGKELLTLSVMGLNEIREFTEIIEYSDNKSFKVTTLPAICILKLISWYDKPAERIKDIDDFTFIISKYAIINEFKIFDNHFDLLSNGWNDDIISPRVLGRDIGSILFSTIKIKDYVINILIEHTRNIHSSPLSVLMSQFNKKYSDDNFNILKELLKGINESLTNVGS